MDWKEYIKTGLKQQDEATGFDFNLPASDNLILELRRQLTLHELPNELEDLYRETNGIIQTIHGENIGELIWPVERVIETNKEYRTNPDFKELYMSFEQLLFFSDAGNGDLFGFVTPNGRFDRNDIFVWNHEEDSRTWVAPDLKTFIEWWTNGTIKV